MIYKNLAGQKYHIILVSQDKSKKKKTHRQINFLEEKINYLKPSVPHQIKNFKGIQIIHEHQTKAIIRPSYIQNCLVFDTEIK